MVRGPDPNSGARIAAVVEFGTAVEFDQAGPGKGGGGEFAEVAAAGLKQEQYGGLLLRTVPVKIALRLPARSVARVEIAPVV
jgi:hypothetical protein